MKKKMEIVPNRSSQSAIFFRWSDYSTRRLFHVSTWNSKFNFTVILLSKQRTRFLLLLQVFYEQFAANSSVKNVTFFLPVRHFEKNLCKTKTKCTLLACLMYVKITFFILFQILSILILPSPVKALWKGGYSKGWSYCRILYQNVLYIFFL